MCIKSVQTKGRITTIFQFTLNSFTRLQCSFDRSASVYCTALFAIVEYVRTSSCAVCIRLAYPNYRTCIWSKKKQLFLFFTFGHENAIEYFGIKSNAPPFFDFLSWLLSIWYIRLLFYTNDAQPVYFGKTKCDFCVWYCSFYQKSMKHDCIYSNPTSNTNFIGFAFWVII